MTRNTKRTGANKPAPEATKPSTDEPTPAEPSTDSTDEPTPAEPSTDSTDSTDEPTPAEPEATDDSRADAFRSAWSAAVEATDDSTGVVPPAVLSPLVEAFRSVKPSKRDDVRGAVMAADTAAAMAASPVDTALLVRSSGVSAALTAAGTKPAVASVTDSDKRAALALALYVLDERDDERDMLASVMGGLSRSDADALATWLSADADDSDPAGIKRARAALRSAGGRSSAAGRSSGGGTRTARSDAPTDEHGKPLPVAGRVRLALDEHDSDGTGMTDTALSKVAGAGGGAIAAVKQAAADTAGIVRCKVNGANGWRVA